MKRSCAVERTENALYLCEIHTEPDYSKKPKHKMTLTHITQYTCATHESFQKEKHTHTNTTTRMPIFTNAFETKRGEETTYY